MTHTATTHFLFSVSNMFRLAVHRLGPALQASSRPFLSRTPVPFSTAPRRLQTTGSTEPIVEEGTPLPAASPAAESNNNDLRDWSTSFHGLSEQAFSKDIADTLLAPLDPLDVEVKPGACHSNDSSPNQYSDRRPDIPS